MQNHQLQYRFGHGTDRSRCNLSGVIHLCHVKTCQAVVRRIRISKHTLLMDFQDLPTNASRNFSTIYSIHILWPHTNNLTLTTFCDICKYVLQLVLFIDMPQERKLNSYTWKDKIRNELSCSASAVAPCLVILQQSAVLVTRSDVFPSIVYPKAFYGKLSTGIEVLANPSFVSYVLSAEVQNLIF